MSAKLIRLILMLICAAEPVYASGSIDIEDIYQRKFLTEFIGIPIYIFKSVLIIPNDYMLVLPEQPKKEIKFTTGDEYILLGLLNDLSQGFNTYVKKHQVDVSVKCGLTVTKINDNGVEVELIDNGSQYIFFSDTELAQFSIASFCENNKKTRQE